MARSPNAPAAEGAAADEVIVLHRRVAAEPADRLAELAEAAAHPLGHDHHGAFAERTGRGRRGGARRAERLEPPPRRLGVERADHARAGAVSLALEASSQGLDRGALALGQCQTVAGELRELHVEVARGTERAQHAPRGPARVRQRHGQLAPEEPEGCVDAARGDSQLVQRLGVVSEARPRLVLTPGPEQPSQFPERHFARRGGGIESGSRGAARRGDRGLRIRRSAGSSQHALAGGKGTLHR